MKALLTITSILAALAVAAPGALGAGKPQGFITDTLGGNGHAARPQSYSSAGSRLRAGEGTGGALNTVAPRPVSQSQGYRFITDTLAPGGGSSIEAAPSATGFSWADAGVGAGTAAGALLVLLGGTLVVARRQDRLAM